jgi:hypothetical protein
LAFIYISPSKLTAADMDCFHCKNALFSQNNTSTGVSSFEGKKAKQCRAPLVLAAGDNRLACHHSHAHTLC